MQYTVRAFIEGTDAGLDGVCRTFCSMERSAYNLLREDAKSGAIKAALRERYAVRNARWIQSAINQANAVMESQQEGIQHRIEMCREKVKNTREKAQSLSNELKIEGCKAKIRKYESKVRELRMQLDAKSYPRAVFGSRRLLRQLSIADGKRRDELRERWERRRSNHFFSVGQANQRGNGNARLSYDVESKFLLEIRNWPCGDFRLPLHLPEHWSGLLRRVIEKAESVKLGRNGAALEQSKKGLSYSVRVVRLSANGYQVLVSFELEAPFVVERSGRLAGIDINPEGVGCAIVSRDGNLIATRFFGDNRLITASRNRRRWVLENLVNRMLRWCKETHGCDAVALETLKFKGAHDFGARTNFKLSNFMKRKMLETIRLDALKMKMLSAEVDPAYSSMVAVAKYGKQFGGFNRHQLAAFVIARRALGCGEAPVLRCLPETKKEERMWNHCIQYYGYQPQIQKLLHHEPMERKSDGDDNGGEVITKLLRAPPATTSSRMGLGHSSPVTAIPSTNGRAGRVHPICHTNGGDGARGHRVSPAQPISCVASLLSSDTEDAVIW